MKNNKITVILEKDVAKKFLEMATKMNWSDKFLIATAIKSYFKYYKKDWKKAIISALEEK